ncbi:MAG: hypothetical protein JW806_03530 [Sedimentisphaerales bacterium]|nr:hypothetical protein [Sedimentisphaerales bacterium]
MIRYKGIQLFIHILVYIIVFPAFGYCADNVSVVREGNDVILDNGIVRAVIDTGRAEVTSLKYDGNEMVSQRGKKNIYFSMTTGAGYERPGHCIYSFANQTGEIADISCRKIYESGDRHAWDIDIHYVMQKGLSGLYSYAIVSHRSDYPDVDMGEWRMVWWMGKDNNDYLLDTICVDELRNWKMASFSDEVNAERGGIKEIVKYTSGARAGRYDCKYMYSADYYKLDAYGFAGPVRDKTSLTSDVDIGLPVSNGAGSKNNIGAWIVLPSHEFFNDGPTKNDLTAAAGIIHLYLNTNHYNGSGFTIKNGQVWQKIYGPWLLYMNKEGSPDACWKDAKKQAQLEREKWPYEWVLSNEYQGQMRGAVKGKLIIKDKLKPDVDAKGAWVGLALSEKENRNWQFQGRGYQYWTKAKANGEFVIEDVRAGDYTLYVFADGVVGEYSKDGIKVWPRETTKMGKIVWKVQHRGKKISWEIGTPDRSAAEFRHGATDYYEPYLFTKFADEFSNPLEYYVSENDWQEVLNYAHNPYKEKEPWKWRIYFSLEEVPLTGAVLTIAAAGAHQAHMYIYVNDESKEFVKFYVEPNRGNGLIREGIHAKYGVHYINIPSGSLKKGQNVITLVQASVSGMGNHIMYDYINMELEPIDRCSLSGWRQ